MKLICASPKAGVVDTALSIRIFGRSARWLSVLCIVLLLSGCGSVTRALTGIFVPNARPDVSEDSADAADIPYASIDIRVAGTGGLLLLTESSGAASYWRSGQGQVVVMINGDLAQTVGLSPDLLSRVSERPQGVVSLDAAVHYPIHVSYESRSGEPRALAGTATLDCSAAAAERELPLATLALRECRETVIWGSGAQTVSTYWLRPETGRIWKARVVAWPSAPVVEWEVARPWW